MKLIEWHNFSVYKIAWIKFGEFGYQIQIIIINLENTLEKLYEYAILVILILFSCQFGHMGILNTLVILCQNYLVMK